MLPSFQSIFARHLQHRHRPVAFTSVILSFSALALGGSLLWQLDTSDVNADIVALPETTCDDFNSWTVANDHFQNKDTPPNQRRALDSNRNHIPCEGTKPRGDPIHQTFKIICNDFLHRDEAELFHHSHDQPSTNNFPLDSDRDNRPCETLPPLDKTTRLLNRIQRHSNAQDSIDRDCSDFQTWQEANQFFIQAGGPTSDPHRLDGNSNGIPCESLPGAPK